MCAGRLGIGMLAAHVGGDLGAIDLDDHAPDPPALAGETPGPTKEQVRHSVAAVDVPPAGWAGERLSFPVSRLPSWAGWKT